MAKNKSLFSKADLYHFADEIVNMYVRFKLTYDLAKAENNKVMIEAYGGIMFELELLINAYGLKELVKID